ncbi:MAG: DUF87 domain-containing protein [Desulfobacterales bacterium]
MKQFEQLGVFYLGRRVDPAAGSPTGEVVLYDSRDLTTHAVIIGMTGSGKTGLGIALLEEALIDRVPVIAIDPKGDLPNLLLTLPELSAEAFLPWVSEADAVSAGLDRREFAARQAALWRKGLAEWEQDAERVRLLREAAEFALYTPGSRAGRPVNLLGKIAPPPEAVRAERDLLRGHLQQTTTGLLALVGVAADPVTSREHILVAQLLSAAWAEGRSLDAAALVHGIQNPPFERVGLLDLESFFPARERFALALRFNNLVASPGFEAWTEGDPLDVGRLLYTEDGRPRASIMTIAHLDDAERMFFVTRLLIETIAWMRAQPGTGSLRAILYMDEIFGFLPPVANPPSKTPLLTLLKQARAFGLGVVLATQNPVDLDYKGLANAGTWFLGRLQTETDRERVLSGLEGASAGAGFDRRGLERILSGLGKRVFLLHRAKENEPLLFQTRWTLSYLRGPMTREDIQRLSAAAGREPGPEPAAPSALPGLAPPLLPPGIPVFTLPPESAEGPVEYLPALFARLEVRHTSHKHGIDLTRRVGLCAFLSAAQAAAPLDWDRARVLDLDPAAFLKGLPAAGRLGELPAAARNAKAYEGWKRELARWARRGLALPLLRCPKTGALSRPGESRAEFLARRAQLLREERDRRVEALRRRYAERFAVLRDRLLRAEQAVAREKEQLAAKKVETAISFGTAILGAFLGRRAVSATSAGRIGTAAKSAGRLRKESMDAARAEESAAGVRERIAALEAALEADIAAIEAAVDPEAAPPEEILVPPVAAELAPSFFALLWVPFRRDAAGGAVPAWKSL